ncbi:MAG: hypothetical protein K0Q75_1833, partial [Anaerospora sp.]|nr:hypothetical protein [Anaerospora sp.]
IYAESTWLETAWEDRESLIEKSTYECKCFFALYNAILLHIISAIK